MNAITRRRALLGGASVAGTYFSNGMRPGSFPTALMNNPAEAGLVTLYAGEQSNASNAAAFFRDGISTNTYPTAAFNNPAFGIFPASAPSTLNLPYWAGSFLFAGWMNSLTPPPFIGSHPFFGMLGEHGNIVTIRLLPPFNRGDQNGIWPVFPYLGNGVFTGVRATYPVLEIVVQNPFSPSLANRFLSFLNNVYTGSWVQIMASYNPYGQSAGTQAGPMQVTLSGRGFSQPGGAGNQLALTYQSPIGGFQRNPPPLINIPTGDAFGTGRPTAWLGYQPSFFGGDPGMGFAQNNAFNGSLAQIIFDVGSFDTPFFGINLMDMINEQVLSTNRGQAKYITLRELELPNGEPAHNPTVLLQGNHLPLTRPTMLQGDTLILNPEATFSGTDFKIPEGFVTIESVTIQSIEEGGRDVGAPFGGSF